MKQISNYCKSPLNYTGGKFKLLSSILPLFPANISQFIDLFGGGANVCVNTPATSILYNDSNIHVVNLLEYFSKHNTDEMLHDIHAYIEKYHLSKENQEGFLKLREEYNQGAERNCIALYVLICYAFNNQIRFNQRNEYNMPFGKNRSSFNPTLEEKFQLFCETLHQKDITIVHADFREFRDIYLESGDFIYCDPPYFNSTATYNECNGWTNKDEEDLRDLLLDLNSRKIRWALSNNLSVNPTLLDFARANKFEIHSFAHSYGNCNYHKKDKNTSDSEVLITNY